MSLGDDLAAILRGLCPARCPRCGEESPAGFCGECSADFARVESPCADCGLPRAGHRCPAGEAWWRLDRVRAPFLYTAPLDRYLQRLKYGRERRLGAALGGLLAAELARTLAREPAGSDALALGRPDRIVAVPLHPCRLRERSFNQADEIARPVAATLGSEHRDCGIRRLRATRPQTELRRNERLRALADAFGVRGRLDALHIAVVDDVMTTGATVNALAAALKAAGARRVEAWAVARAPGHEDDVDQPARNR